MILSYKGKFKFNDIILDFSLFKMLIFLPAKGTGASLSKATRGGSRITVSLFSVMIPWYDVSIQGLCLFTRKETVCLVNLIVFYIHLAHFIFLRETI